MVKYSPEMKFSTYELYLEAWRYLMRTGQGFMYCNHPNELTISVAITGDEREDTETMERLNEILEGQI